MAMVDSAGSNDQDLMDVVGRIVITDRDGKRGFSWRGEIVNSTFQKTC